MRSILKYLLIQLVVFILSISIAAQDKIIKKEIIPTPEEKKKLKDEDPKEATYPTLDNFKKEFENLPKFKKKYIPAPVVYADPNTGFSYGAGVGIIFYDNNDEIRHLIGPYIHYNKNTGEGVTGRYIFMPTAKERYYYKISKSVNVNEEYLAEYTNQKFYLENASFSALADIYSEGTSRFYGVGRSSRSEDKMNYNHAEQTYQIKLGYFINRFADFNLRFEFFHIDVKKGVEENTPQVIDAFKDHSLVRKTEGLAAKLELGFNLLGELDEEEASMRFSVWGEQGFSLFGEDELFEKWGSDLKFNWNFHPKISWAGWVSYREVHGNDLPFYLLSSLGGSRSFRGYELGRLYDNNAVLGMTELRWKFGTLNKFNFKTVWELAFFYDVGQVGAKDSDFAINHLEHSGGIGIRTHFGENLLTRIDLSIANEGFKIYVDFGYPF